MVWAVSVGRVCGCGLGKLALFRECFSGVKLDVYGIFVSFCHQAIINA